MTATKATWGLISEAPSHGRDKAFLLRYEDRIPENGNLYGLLVCGGIRIAVHERERLDAGLKHP
jgi:hypothetical protein